MTDVGATTNNEKDDQVGVGVFVEVPKEEIMKMKSEDLRLQLSLRGLNVKGLLKKDLQARLKEAMVKRVKITKRKSDVKKKKKGDDLAGFKQGSYWKVLTPNEVPVLEPANPTFINPRAPT